VPKTEVILFAEDDGSSPLLEWLDGLPQKAQVKCVVRIELLAKMGHELRRPLADFPRDDIHELRASFGGIHYRMLYFFHGKLAVVSHGLIKEREVPPREIDSAIERKMRFQADPQRHTFHMEGGEVPFYEKASEDKQRS